MIEDSQEQNEIELLLKLSHVINRQTAKFNFCLTEFSCQTGLGQISLFLVDSDYPFRTAPLHLYGVKPGITAYIQDRFSPQVSRHGMSKSLPLDPGIVSEKMGWGSLHTSQGHIMKPITELLDPLLNFDKFRLRVFFGSIHVTFNSSCWRGTSFPLLRAGQQLF